jgi:hypothetical protein
MYENVSVKIDLLFSKPVLDWASDKNNLRNLLKEIEFPEDLKIKIELKHEDYRFNNVVAYGSYWCERNLVEIYNHPVFRDLSSFIFNLTHELIHAKQYHEDRLFFRGMGFIEFDGQEYNIFKVKTQAEYANQPWEKEANTAALEVIDKMNIEHNVYMKYITGQSEVKY